MAQQPTLTDLQLKVLRYMHAFLLANHQLPTNRQMCHDFGWDSPNAAQDICDRMEMAGALERNELGNRMLSASGMARLGVAGNAIGAETLLWRDALRDTPDVDITVMVEISDEDASEPVWPGWWDGEVWRDALGMEVQVVRWAEMPQGCGGARAHRARAEPA